MNKGLLVVVALLSTVATASWAEEPVGCRKPEIQAVTQTKAATVKWVRELATLRIAEAINDFAFGKHKRGEEREIALKKIMQEKYFLGYTKNLHVQVDTYLVDNMFRAALGNAIDPCLMKITISGVPEVQGTVGEFPFNMLTTDESRPDAVRRIQGIVSNFGGNVSASVSKNYIRIIANEWP